MPRILENPNALTSEQVAALVDEGSTLKVQIDALSARLSEIGKALKAHALACPQDHVPLKDEEREGTRLLCRGSAVAVPVIMTTDLIAQTLADGSAELAAVKDCAGEKLPLFYRRSVVWQSVHVRSNRFDGRAFRALARRELPDPERFIAACVRRRTDGTPLSQIKVDWSELAPL